MPRIDWIDENQATGELAELYRRWFDHNPGRSKIPEILKCFSHRPDFLTDVIRFSNGVHFTDGHLPVRVKEMIATFVSGLNSCDY